MSTRNWQGLAESQHGVVSRRQLNELGFDAGCVRRKLRSERWQELSPTVVCTTTGPLSRDQQLWLGALHVGGDSLIGGLTAAEVHGLRNWHRDEVTVLIGPRLHPAPLPGINLTRTRRSLSQLRHSRRGLPLCRLEPTVLLFAASTRSERTAQGLLAAVVQQQLTTPGRLAEWVENLRPLRRAALFRQVLRDIEGGAQSLAEIDIGRLCRRFGLPAPVRQRHRRDSSGRSRWTDCEWELSSRRVLVLEIDGSFHMAVEHWEDDLVRQRRLSNPGRIIVRCTARELRDEPESVLRDLRALGLRRVSEDADIDHLRHTTR